MKLDNSFYKLPSQFYKKQKADLIKQPELLIYNQELSDDLDLRLNFDDEKLAQFFSGNELLPGSQPISLAYAGHQFAHFVPLLGDGRAVLLGEILDDENRRFDIQLKGSGRTFFSRNGDGKCPLDAAIREYIVSEAMHYLGVPTTRSLAIILTNESIQREKMVPGAIIARIAASHIRIGTFQYFAAQGDVKNTKILADYAIQRHYPECQLQENPYLSFFEAVCENQLKLISSWMQIGFIHGVMNTDNTTISGETIDYGPCAFMDEYKSDKTFSSIDRYGRYNFSNQKNVILWNLSRLAESILPLIDKDTEKAIKLATVILENANNLFEKHHTQKMAQKIGIFNYEPKDQSLIDEFLKILEENNLDFTNNFRNLSKILTEEKYDFDQSLNSWKLKWEKRLKTQNLKMKDIVTKMNQINPAIIPRNHIIARIIKNGIEENNFDEMKVYLKALIKPFTETQNYSNYQKPPSQDEIVKKTFCGT